MDRRRLLALAVGCSSSLLFPSLYAQEGPSTIRVIVRAESKGDAAPALQASDVKVNFNGHDTPVTRMTPLMRSTGQPVEVALLIDDSLRSDFGTQLQEIERFARGIVSPQVSLGIGYMQNGRAVFPSGFSTNADNAAKGIRLPLSSAGISGSPYFCLQDLVKHWPTNTGAPHVVLMITNGIDLYNGAPVPQNQSSPYVDAAVTDAQRAGVPVYSIYFGRFEVNSNLGSFSGQSYLGQVAEQTGGKLFNQGTINPPSIGPYLKQFETSLRESYLLSFQTGTRKLQQLRVRAPKGVKLRVQSQASAQASR